MLVHRDPIYAIKSAVNTREDEEWTNNNHRTITTLTKKKNYERETRNTKKDYRQPLRQHVQYVRCRRRRRS